MSLTVRETIVAARDRLNGHWLQGDLNNAYGLAQERGHTVEGMPMPLAEDRNDCDVCLVGAFDWVLCWSDLDVDQATYSQATALVREQAERLYPNRLSGWTPLPDLNDHEDTTERDVLRVLNAAIDRATLDEQTQDDTTA